MKGMVFTEFLDMVEETFSIDMVDDIIDAANPKSGGAYTSVGVYDHQELVDMVIALSERTDIAPDDLVKAFGQHLFKVFFEKFPSFFKDINDSFTFLSSVEDYIHPEVKKLYPDAQLPRFDCQREGNTLNMIYHSSRHFSDLAEGLIIACARHYGEQVEVKREMLDENSARFQITRC